MIPSKRSFHSCVQPLQMLLTSLRVKTSLVIDGLLTVPHPTGCLGLRHARNAPAAELLHLLFFKDRGLPLHSSDTFMARSLSGLYSKVNLRIGWRVMGQEVLFTIGILPETG